MAVRITNVGAAFSAALAFRFLFASAAAAQQPIPRTPDGHPDFQGIWESNILPKVERLPGATALVVDDAEAKRLSDAYWSQHFEDSPVYDPHENLGMARNLSRVNGEWRTGLVTEPPDGKIPLTEAGRKLLAASRTAYDGPPRADYETRPWKERCLAGPARAPLLVSPTDNMRQIVQTPGHVMIWTEDDGGEARIAGIGAARRPAALTSFLGDSVARWDGDTLVIDTTNARDEQAGRSASIVARQAAHVVERLSYISPDEVLYRFTIEDPLVFARPWSGEYSFRRSKRPTFETDCHGGNYALPNVLSGAREVERRATAGKANPR